MSSLDMTFHGIWESALQWMPFAAMLPGFLPAACPIPDSYNYIQQQPLLLKSLRSIGKFFVFVAGGLVAIIVGSFMIRGTMHMWDRPESKDSESKDDD